MKTLFELKQNLVTIGQQLQKTEGELSQKAVDPSASMEDIKTLQKTKEDLKARFDVIKEQHDKLEAEQQAELEAKAKAGSLGISNENDPKQKAVKAKAELFSATMANKPVPVEVFQVLGDDSSTKGGKFLPKTVASDIISEPLVKNQLRELSTFTSITNLEIPKINFTLDDDDFIADKETAKELKATGDLVTFGRNKFKVYAGISETVLQGTHANLVSHVEGALQSGVAAKERKVAFATSPKTGEEHMSFYSTQNNIKKVEGDDLYQAIRKAIADLHEDYRENAVVVMRYQDYSDIIEKLANGNATLYSVQPEQILGKRVVFSDAAIDPIVGNFAYSHFNYDIGTTLYERDKDVKTGIEQFVVTAWFDHQIKLKSAFRIVKVTPTP
ncbi:phage major capsid protein [Bacillus cihuensis]|uniref:phage major capsid protein n=1 Tax=Bacillus cihuensis TaxID=1208599 RepID=UPI00041D601D|nr:phage major capsid protein [Bacillus cihuensis]